MITNTCATQNTLPDLSVEDVQRLIESFPRLKNPFEMLAESGGCDLAKGDWLIVPERWFLMLPELEQFRGTKGVKVRNEVEVAYLLDGKLSRAPSVLRSRMNR